MKLKLSEWRRARNVSQETLAQLCQVHVNTYRRWEEDPGEIKYNDAVLIADFLQIKLDDILFPSNTTKTDKITEKAVM
ncbi:MAG: helix-turn-helix transcriptional regulator [Treponema sp.]|nr:helix-turn-helix transcriptional regulator [Treponema sp.]